MVFVAFFLVAFLHTVIILLVTPVLLVIDVIIGMAGVVEGSKKSEIADTMWCGYSWEQVGRSWAKVVE
jgi:hypothetical protein